VAIAIMRDRVLALKGASSGFRAAVGAGAGGHLQLGQGDLQLSDAPLDPKELDAPADFPSIWLQRRAANRGDGAALGRQQHRHDRAQQERRLRHRHHAADHRLRASAGWRSGSSTPSRQPSALFPVDQPSPPAARRSTRNTAPPATAPRAGLQRRVRGPRDALAEIGTDRRRLDSYTYTLAVNQATLYAGYPWRFTQFRKTHGYANMPLDGIWLRALPAQRLGAQPARPARAGGRRPAVFWRGNDVFDPVGRLRVGPGRGGRAALLPLRHHPARQRQRRPRGPAYGTELPEADKAALVEFLKTF
jgi:hypothetical protein